MHSLVDAQLRNCATTMDENSMDEQESKHKVSFTVSCLFVVANGACVWTMTNEVQSTRSS